VYAARSGPFAQQPRIDEYVRRHFNVPVDRARSAPAVSRLQRLHAARAIRFAALLVGAEYRRPSEITAKNAPYM
jgi:hypothetical protein